MSVHREGFRKRHLIRPVYLPAVLMVAAETALLPVLPVSAVNYGLNLAAAGAILSAMLIGSLIAELPGARVIAQLGEKKAIVVSGLLFAGFALIPATGLGLWTLLLGAIGIGVTVAVTGLARHSLVAGFVPNNQRARSLSALGGMFRAGWTIGPILGSLVISWFGLSATYVFSGVLALLAVCLIALYPKKKLRVEHAPSTDGVLKVALANRKVLSTIGVAAGIIQGARVTRLIGLPLLAVYLELDPALSALLIGVTSIVDVLFFSLAGWVMDRFGRFWGTVPTLLLLGIAYSLTPLVTDANGFALLALLTAFANGMSAGVNMVLGADLAPAGSRAEFLASFRLMTSIGSTLAPIAVTGFTALVGIPLALTIVSSSNFLGAFLFARHLPRYGMGRRRIEG